LESYLGNCQRYARTPGFVVADDSPSAEAEDRTRGALRRLADRFNARIQYGGWQEKRRFAAASTVSREIIHFARFGDERCPQSTGANRNLFELPAPFRHAHLFAGFSRLPFCGLVAGKARLKLPGSSPGSHSIGGMKRRQLCPSVAVELPLS
jgi:hypothetical protein